MDETRSLISAGIAAMVREATTPPAPWGYGRDLRCVNDLTPTLQETDGDTTESLAQDLFHRFTTERGTIPDDKDFGEDCRSFLSAAMTDRELVSIGGRLTTEALKDDRVAGASVEATYAAGELTITAAITPEDPRLTPFVMIMAVTAATAQLISVSSNG